MIGVELVEEAVLAARQNAKLNGLENCEFIAGDVLKVLDDIEEKPNYIVLDPPRDGIHPKALKKIIAYQVDRIVYISCKPTSLARDLEALLDGGYRMERVVAVDQFPQTGNVKSKNDVFAYAVPTPDLNVGKIKGRLCVLLLCRFFQDFVKGVCGFLFHIFCIMYISIKCSLNG